MSSPVLDAVMPFDMMRGLDLDRVGFLHCLWALILLRGAHRPHREFETLGELDVRR
jgi:hypothetical protein